MRSRVRATIVLAFFFITAFLVLPLRRRAFSHSHSNKIRIYLDEDVAVFQKQFYKEHQELGRCVACPEAPPRSPLFSLFPFH
jgi:hypothetical protein